MSSTPRTALRRHAERGHADRQALYAVLDAALICHLGVVAAGAPRVLPTAYARVGDTVYLHGSTANASYRAAAGREVCVTVTLLDGLVYARSVFSHSMNYRSAMIFGVARPVTDPPERSAALRAITEHLTPGQWSYARQPTRKELAATSVLALPLTEASVKIRAGGPSDEPEDHAMDVWAGVVPVAVVFGAPQADAALRPGIGVPGHVRRHAS
ncbi:MAG: pyridoxamine 5'-phosphate oxidase family protein [Streptosporangiaceae bacterium]|nr:pyridoxamine 5'-phosphate oxidase family protein [Streptosporangiaceae bacterium]